MEIRIKIKDGEEHLRYWLLTKANGRGVFVIAVGRPGLAHLKRLCELALQAAQDDPRRAMRILPPPPSLREAIVDEHINAIESVYEYIQTLA